MRIFLDTSALFKLYHREIDTDKIENLFSNNVITTTYLSEITKIEFASTIAKKVRTQDLSKSKADELLSYFESDFKKYSFVQIDSIVIEQARNLIIKYGALGLRSLDSIQLATAVSLQNKASLFVTTDKLLNAFLKQESLNTEII